MKDSYLETDIHCMSGGMDQNDCQEVLRGPLIWMTPILL